MKKVKHKKHLSGIAKENQKRLERFMRLYHKTLWKNVGKKGGIQPYQGINSTYHWINDTIKALEISGVGINHDEYFNLCPVGYEINNSSYRDVLVFVYGEFQLLDDQPIEVSFDHELIGNNIYFNITHGPWSFDGWCFVSRNLGYQRLHLVYDES